MAKRTMKRKTKPNPTDATMRNIHAHRRRIANLEKRVIVLDARVNALYVEAAKNVLQSDINAMNVSVQSDIAAASAPRVDRIGGEFSK